LSFRSLSAGGTPFLFWRSGRRQLFLFAENEDIKNFQYGQSVDYQKRDKPPFMIVSGRFPQSHSFPGDGPGDDQKNNPGILSYKLFHNLFHRLIIFPDLFAFIL